MKLRTDILAVACALHDFLRDRRNLARIEQTIDNVRRLDTAVGVLQLLVREVRRGRAMVDEILV